MRARSTNHGVGEKESHYHVIVRLAGGRESAWQVPSTDDHEVPMTGLVKAIQRALRSGLRARRPCVETAGVAKSSAAVRGQRDGACS
jgi:hypothetical protein